MKLTPEQLAEIRRCGSLGNHQIPAISELLAHIAIVEVERDAARNLIEEMRALQREGAEKPG